MKARAYVWTKAQQDTLKALKTAIGKSYSPTVDELTVPPQEGWGDIAFPCFGLAHGLGRNPAEIATEIAAKIGPKGLIASVNAKGPYVNVTLDLDAFAAAVLKEVQTAGDAYGRQNIGKGRRIMVEYANPNTHKEIHVGHLRNVVVGHLTINLLRAVGYDVVAASYINDLGNNVAKCLWALRRRHEGEKPRAGDEINFLGALYTEATRTAEEDASVREDISEIQRQLEGQRGEWHALWKETRRWSLNALHAVFRELGLPIDRQYYESELIEEAREIVRALQDQGIAMQDDGAIVVHLEEEGLGVNLLVKSDGTLLYNAKDLALALRKSKDYALDRSLIVVDERQSLAMRQLFATLKRMGVEIPYEHLSYNFVTLPEGAMSSRKGTVVRYETLRDTLREAAEEATRARHADWSSKRVAAVSRALAHAAMIYTMARQDPKKDIVFDLKEAMAFEGATGPYLLYATSRISSLLASSRVKPAFYAGALGREARPLVRLMARYPQVLAASAYRLALADVPQFAFELAQAFSSYYGAVRVIDEGDAQGTAARLALSHAVLVTLRNAMAMMNIAALEEM